MEKTKEGGENSGSGDDRFPDGVSPLQTMGNNRDATGDGREQISKIKQPTKENNRQDQEMVGGNGGRNNVRIY